jgi:16S rRNA C1402 (ribose-2'-O) methylase RsmI
LRGEITIVVQGAPASQRRRVLSEDADPRKAALAAVADAYGIPRKAAYDAIVAAKKSTAQET